MVQLRGSNVISTESRSEFDELDHVPLITRQKSLLASKRTGKSSFDAVVKKEDEDNEVFLSSPFVRGMDHQLALKRILDSEAPLGVTSEVSNGEVSENSTEAVGMDDDAGLEKVEVSIRTLYKNEVLSNDSTKVKVENSDNNVLSAQGDGHFAGTDAQTDKANTNTPDDSADDDLDHIVLKDRRRMLLQRRCLELEKQVEGGSAGFSEDLIDRCAGRTKEDIQSAYVESSMTGGEDNEMPDIKVSSNLGKSSVNASSETIIAASSFAASQHSVMPGKSLMPEVPNSRKNMGTCETMCLSARAFEEFNSPDGQFEVQPGSISMHIPTLQTSVKVKVEPMENSELNHSEKNSLSMCSSERAFMEFNSCDGLCELQPGTISMQVSTLQTPIEVKVEPMENSDLNPSEKNSLSNFSFKTPVKSKEEIPDELHGDRVDNMPLQFRMKKRTLAGKTELNCSSNVSARQDTHIAPESAKPIGVGRPRKRKKTATDSVETALEEDAPGLLQVLREQGVSVDEIKLYGEMDSDDDLDEALNEDSFSELEAVMSKLFFQRNSLLKFASVRCTKDSKPSYCLACLFSLVEQARYLQFRKWPVEWGWCRDVQSFIFVFKRHNRIVLERPEYGYATYFFELVDLVPLDWQIKRLVTTMKLTSCGRVNLIENKSLSVGEELTEGEARVLMEFGWVPNTGLGTMLNYRDRVFHDRKNGKDVSEWRSKISKLLVDGYHGGTIVSTNIPDNVIKYKGADSPDVKLEL